LKKAGIIAGRGQMPLLVKRELETLGYETFVISLSEEISDKFAAENVASVCIPPVQVGKIIKTLLDENAMDVVFAGKVDKSVLLEKLRFDPTLVKLLFKVKDYRDDTLMNAVRDEFLRRGMNILRQPDILGRYLAPKGLIGSRKPTRQEEADIAFGLEMAKKIGELDIGQTVVVRKRAVMSVEAIEGTDEAVRRGCLLAKEGAVVVKAKRPYQDDRFDIPTVGVDTLKQIADNSGSVLAVEAGSTFVVDMAKCREYADSRGICFIGC
jgi:DUF1009 family protein